MKVESAGIESVRDILKQISLLFGVHLTRGIVVEFFGTFKNI